MSQHIYTYDPANDQLNEIGGAGHIIKDGSGTSFTKRENLQFDGCSVTDDSTNNATIIQPLDTNFVGTSQEFWNLTRAQRAQYKTVDLTDDFNGSPIDSALSTTSENPVQNKVITTAINGRAPEDHSSANSTYGVGSATKYGHVKVDDELSSTSTNPVQNKVVNSVFEALSNQLTAETTARQNADSNINEDLTNEVTTRVVNGAHNLLEISAINETRNGITLIVNEDKTITLSTGSGGATALTQFRVNVTTKFYPYGNFILTGCPVGGSLSTFDLRTSNDNDEHENKVDIGNGVSFSRSAGLEDGLWAIITIRSGQVLTPPITFKPMIRRASDTDTTYQPYAMTNRELTEKVVNPPHTLGNRVDISGYNSSNNQFTCPENGYIQIELKSNSNIEYIQIELNNGVVGDDVRRQGTVNGRLIYVPKGMNVYFRYDTSVTPSGVTMRYSPLQ